MNVVGIGPFVGSIEEEIITFRPYSLWLSETIENSKIYISTHFNRRFLYSWVNDECFIPIHKHYTRDEINQQGYVHKKITQKDYLLQLKRFKEHIHKTEKINKKSIESYNLSYSRSTPPYSIYNKIFTKLDIPEIDISVKDRVVFIPSAEESIDRCEKIYDFLYKEYNAIIVGDTKIHFFRDNEAIKHIDYLENNLLYILNYLNHAKYIICPASFWTMLCNLQGWKVFSWGDLRQYREGGIYWFNNKKFDGIITNSETNINIIKNTIKRGIK